MSQKRLLVIGLVGAVCIPVLLVVAYFVDDGGRGNHVASNVSLAGHSVAGLSGRDLTTRVDRLAREVERSDVEVDAPRGGFTAPAARFELRVDRDATADAARAVGRRGNVLTRAWSWLRAFVWERPAPLLVNVSRNATYALVTELDEGPRTAPVEPSLKLENGRFVAVEGKAGRGIDPADVITALEQSARSGNPVKVRVSRGAVAPRLTLEEVQALARRANDLVNEPLAVRAGTASAEVPVATLRRWVQPVPTEDGVDLGVDAELTMEGLRELLPNAGRAATEARFSVQGGQVLIIEGANGTACCDAASADLISAAIKDRPEGTLELPLRVIEPRMTTAAARDLKIGTAVGSFTTNFRAGEARVKNIHRMADLVRGQVIRPGGTFSVNDFVGRRTTAKGFVTAGVIADGVFEEDVGGGVSQFATTLFNAAFFAGLEFRTYQSHSIYISRYPYGREATLGFPSPDLAIRNPSPYGVLIWPTYTGSSITITLYSTKWVEASQSGQSSAPSGACTRVRTERTRRYVSNGKTETDSVFALYRPREGVNCDGSVNPRVTTTRPAPPPTTAPPAEPPPTAPPTTAAPAPPPTAAPPAPPPTAGP